MSVMASRTVSIVAVPRLPPRAPPASSRMKVYGSGLSMQGTLDAHRSRRSFALVCTNALATATLRRSVAHSRGSEVPAHVQIEEQLAERIASRELSCRRAAAARARARQGPRRQPHDRAPGAGFAGLARARGARGRARHLRLASQARPRSHAGRPASPSGWSVRAWSRAPRCSRGWSGGELGDRRRPRARARQPRGPIRRLRLGSGVPLAIEDSWFPGKFPGIADRDFGLDLRTDARGVRARAGARGRAPRAGDRARARGQGAGHGGRAPLMLVERTAYAADGTPRRVRPRPPLGATRRAGSSR